jgi:hypothetical protein
VNQLRKSDICTMTSIVIKSAFNTANHRRYYSTSPYPSKRAFAMGRETSRIEGAFHVDDENGFAGLGLLSIVHHARSIV